MKTKEELRKIIDELNDTSYDCMEAMADLYYLESQEEIKYLRDLLGMVWVQCRPKRDTDLYKMIDNYFNELESKLKK